jgi:UDP-glucose 6-dehydrogenase
MYGIIGYGTVGRALGNALYEGNAYWVRDTSIAEDVSEYNIKNTAGVFICVPTPSVEGEGYDITQVKSALSWLVQRQYTGVVILHSTINYTDWDALTKYPGLNLAYSPEYLTASTANDDWLEARTISYGPWTHPAADKKILAALKESRRVGVIVKRKTIKELCITKTGTNLALTLKLLTANLIYMECMEAGLDHKVAQGIVDSVFTDPRLQTTQEYHTCGLDGHLGAGGDCLPKDLVAKVPSHNDRSIRGNIMSALVEFNTSLRSLRKQGK